MNIGYQDSPAVQTKGERSGSHIVRWHSAKVHERVIVLSVGFKNTGSEPLNIENPFMVQAMYPTNTIMVNTMAQTTNGRLCLK